MSANTETTLIPDGTDPLVDMADLLCRHGDRFAGTDAEEVAQDWLDHDFTAGTAEKWCDIGVWDAATATAFRDSGHSPEQIEAASESLTEDLDDPGVVYTDGDPIYAACNGDLSPQVIIDAAR